MSPNENIAYRDGVTGRERLALYHFPYCPFCVMVDRAIQRLGLDIERRNIRQNRAYAEELYGGGGRTTVPCLRIETPDGEIRWLYESRDIIAWLERYGGEQRKMVKMKEKRVE